MDILKLMKEQGVCCISGKPLHDSHLNIVQLNFKASWNYPVWGNFLTGNTNMAIAYVHDDYVINGWVKGIIQHAVEINAGKIIYHPARFCRVCGCSDGDACFHQKHGNCWWVEKDLCSHCKNVPGEAVRYSEMELNRQEIRT